MLLCMGRGPSDTEHKTLFPLLERYAAHCTAWSDDNKGTERLDGTVSVHFSGKKKWAWRLLKKKVLAVPVRCSTFYVLLQPYHTHTMRIGLVKTDWPIAKNSHTHQPTKPQRITPLLSRSSAYAAHDLFVVMIHLRLHTFISLTLFYD